MKIEFLKHLRMKSICGAKYDVQALVSEQAQLKKIRKQQYDKMYHAKTIEAKKIYQKSYYKENKNQRLEYQSGYYTEHKDEKLEYQKEYYKENKEERLEYQRKYHQNNKQKRKQYKKLRAHYQKFGNRLNEKI